jgi:outer membrane murein-binding lipoprotein Lpp
MGNKSKLMLAAAVLGVWGLPVRAEDPSVDTLRKKVDALSAEVEQLRSEQAQNSKDVAATIDAVLRDAEHRSQLLAANGESGAGYDNGFYIKSGDFVLRPHATFQARYVADYRENTSGAKADETETGFEIRRMKLVLQGTAFSPDLSYYFRWDTRTASTKSDVKDANGVTVGSVDNKNGGSLYLRDAWVKYDFTDSLGVRLGQIKDPVSREQLTSDENLVPSERSIADAIFGTGYTDRVQGVSLVYGDYDQKNPIFAELAFTDGLNSLNTSFAKSNFDFGIAGRAEWKVFGDWKSYSDFTAKNNKQDLLVIGGGFDWSQSGDGNSLLGTVDAQWENTSGIGLYAGLLVRNLDKGLTGGTSDQTDWGAVVQASWLVDPVWEIFGRYSFVGFDSPVSAAGNQDQFHEITVGLNYYLGNGGSALHRAKITVDLNYLPNGSPGSLSAQDYLGDSNGKAEVVLRGQFQLSI